ncbi:uncharacterized protein [Engystomops pustulosus]|uniref:uncharacterized protein n=1 Tax=Engystomops pustulosus TaxID=76066 RepID=UPI003AFA4382
MDKDEITRRIFSLALEIIYLLSGEAYTLVKKTSDDPEAPSSHLQESGGWSWSPSAKLPPHPQIHEQRILELTMKMTALLTGEVPIRCQDVAVYFSMEEREYIEGHKDLYQDVMMEDPRPRTSHDGSSRRNPPEMFPSRLYPEEVEIKEEEMDPWSDPQYGIIDGNPPERSPSLLYPQDGPEETPNVPESHQGEDGTYIISEAKEKRMRSDHPCKREVEEDIPVGDTTGR